MSSFGKRLRELRVAKRLTMKEVASQIGVPLTTYREWEYGRGIVGEPYLKIAKVFGVGVYELLSGQSPLPEGVSREVAQIEKHLKRLKRELEKSQIAQPEIRC